MAETTVLLTGATGFLGGALAVALLQSAAEAEPLFLVRAANAAAGRDRVRRSLARFGIDAKTLGAISERQIVCGDLAAVEDFGDDPRLDAVSHVVNCAATTSFSNHPSLWQVNVNGTLSLARRMSKNKRLVRFLHVSTAMACGPRRESPVQESWDLPRADQHLVAYTASKAECELRLRNELPALPLIVARPSIVVGHTKLGCAVSTSIFWVFRMAHLLEKFTCELEERIDVVPVDYCADILLRLLFANQPRFDLYHISAGTQRSDSFRDIDLALADAVGTQTMAPRYRRFAPDEVSHLLPEFVARLGGGNRRLIAKAVRLYGAFAALNYVFDNRRLLGEGFLPPPRFCSYIAACARSCEQIPLAEQMLDDLK